MLPSALPVTGRAAGWMPPFEFPHAAWTIPVAVGATWSVAALLSRKRLAWRADLDTPVGLVPGEQRGTDDEMIKIVFPGPGGSGPGTTDEAWLVLLTVTNIGLVAIGDEDFTAPLTFAFPGRHVRGAQLRRSSRDGRTAHRAEMTPAVYPEPSPSPSRIQFSGRFLLNRSDQFTLMVILTGTPASPVQLHGSLHGGRITTGPFHASSTLLTGLNSVPKG